MSLPMARVGDVLELSRTRINPVETEEYQQIGVYSWGKGIIENRPIPGHELSKVTYYKLPPNALVLSNIQAWESAIAVSENHHGKFIASQRFLPYLPIASERIDVRYACHYFLSESGIAQIRRASPGSITRNRTLGIKAFEELRIPLPSITEQRAIAARLDQASAVSGIMAGRKSSVQASAAALLRSLYNNDSQSVALRQLLTETARFEAIEPDSRYRTAGVKWYAEGVFARDAKPSGEIKATRLNRLVPGEFIYNRLFAWKGSFALVPEAELYVSNEFPTFSIDESQVLSEYLIGWFSLPSTWDEVLRLSTGATPTSRNRLKQEQLLGLKIPLPPLDEQTRVVECLRPISGLRSLNSQRDQIARALPQAARNAEFARLMS